MRITSLIIFICAMLSATFGCRTRQIARIDVPTEASHTVEAFGAEFDPHFWSQNIVMGRADTSAWETVCRRVEAMGLKRMRVMLMPAWYEPVNDNNDPNITDTCAMTMNSVEMQSLYRVLDLAKRCGTDVTLVMWGCNRTRHAVIDTTYRSAQTHFLAAGNSCNDWCVPSKHTEEWCENISAALRHLLITKGYDCIREFTLMNEPSWAYNIDGNVDREAYSRMCHAIDERLRKDGLRDMVRFNLSDDAENPDFLRHAVATVNDVADLYNSHTYKFGYETPDSVITAWERENAAIVAPTGKRHFIGEFGSNLTQGASRQKDIDLYQRGVLMTRIALSLLNGGAAGISYWSLLDQYYSFTDPYESMQQLGLWRSLKQEYRTEPYYDSIRYDFEPRPQYYAYSLLTRHIPPHTQLYPLQTGNEFVQASAFRTTDGGWIYVAVNGSDEAFEAEIGNAALQNGTFDIYRYEKGSLPEDDSLIQACAREKVRRGTLRIRLEAQTTLLCVSATANNNDSTDSKTSE